MKVHIDEASRIGPAFGLSILQKLAEDGDPEAVKRYEKAKAEYHRGCHMRANIVDKGGI